MELIYKAGDESECLVRAYNRMYRLLRGPKSRTFLDISDQGVIEAIAGEASLSAQCGSRANIQHRHVYQHNQDDLSSLRLRAARIGYEIWVEHNTLHFDSPRLERDSGVRLEVEGADGTATMLSFSPRMVSAAALRKVIVRGWDLGKMEEIIGEAQVPSSEVCGQTSSVFDSVLSFEFQDAISGVEEANALAKAWLEQHTMSHIAGEGVSMGNLQIMPGVVVGATHIFESARGENGYRSSFLVRRDMGPSGVEEVWGLGRLCTSRKRTGRIQLHADRR